MKEAKDKLEKLTQEKLSQKKFQLGEKIWFMLEGLIAIEGFIKSSNIGEEKYTIVVNSPTYVTFRFFEVTDKQIAKSKEELEKLYCPWSNIKLQDFPDIENI